jgi:hypothetical protein
MCFGHVFYVVLTLNTTPTATKHPHQPFQLFSSHPFTPFPFVTFIRHVCVSWYCCLRAVVSPLLLELSNNNQREQKQG